MLRRREKKLSRRRTEGEKGKLKTSDNVLMSIQTHQNPLRGTCQSLEAPLRTSP